MLGIKTHCYATGPQDDLAGQKEVEGGHAVKLLKMWEITPVHNAEIRQDYHPDTRDACEDIPLDQGPHEVTGESYLLGAGTQGAAPDLDNVFCTAFEKKAAGAASQNGNETETDKVTTQVGDDDWEAGHLLKVEGPDVDRYVLALSKSGETYTVWPPFDSPLEDGDSIRANVNYGLQNDNGNAVTLYTVDDTTAVTGIGAAFSRFVFTFARGQAARLELSGQCREIKRVFETELDGALGSDPDTDTTVVLADPSCESGAVIHVIDSDSDEEYILLGETDDNLTFEDCVRDWPNDPPNPKNLSDGSSVSGYKLTDTTDGSPIRGLFGGITISPADDDKRTVMLPADLEAVVTIDEKQKMLGWFGDGGKVMQKLCPENREVSLSIAGYCDQEMVSTILDMVNNRSLRVLIQCGESAGRSFAVALPNVRFHPPLIGDAKGDVAKVTLESRAVMFDAEHQIDSVVFAY